MTEHDHYLRDEVSLADFFHLIEARKRCLISLLLLSLAVAGAVIAATPSQWEAVATIRIAAVATVGAVESQASTVVRMNLVSFKNAVVKQRRLASKSRDAELFRSSAKAKALGAGDLVQYSVRGYTRDQAYALAEDSIAHLSEVHRRMAEDKLDNIREFLDQTNQEIERLRRDREARMEVASVRTSLDQKLVAANTAVQRDSQIHKLQEHIAEYRALLDPLKTYPTGALESIYIAEHPIAPKKGLILVSAVLVGLSLGLIVALLCKRCEGKHSNG